MGLVRPPQSIALRATATSRLLDFFTVVTQDIPKPCPTLFRQSNSGSEIGLYFGYTHVDTSVVLTWFKIVILDLSHLKKSKLTNVEIEIFIIHVHVPSFWQIRFVCVFVGAEFVQKIGQSVTKLDHTLCRYRNLFYINSGLILVDVFIRSRNTCERGPPRVIVCDTRKKRPREFSFKSKQQRLLSLIIISDFSLPSSGTLSGLGGPTESSNLVTISNLITYRHLPREEQQSLKVER